MTDAPDNVTPIRPDQPEEVRIPIRTMFSVAYDESGGAHFSFSGSKPNLMELMGLLDHARRNIDILWGQAFGPRVVKP
jgi:hypothetical protein